MKQSILVVLFTLLFKLVVLAQITPIAESNDFLEPNKGFSKLIVLNDGSSAYLEINRNFGIRIKSFDKNYKETLANTITSKFGKMGYTEMTALFEVEGNIVLFMTEYELTSAHTYRFIINPKDGTLIGEDNILGEVKKVSIGANYAKAKGGSVLPKVIVGYDRKSQYYATAFVNTSDAPSERALFVKLYDPKNQLVNSHTFFWGKDNTYKHLRLQDIVVHNKNVYTTLYAFDLNIMQEEHGRFIIVDCSAATEKNTEFTSIESDKDIDPQTAKMQFCAADNNVYIACQYYIPKKYMKDETTAFESGNRLYVYNPPSKKIIETIPLSLKGIKEFESSFQDFYMNDDGSYSLVYELFGYTVTGTRTSYDYGSNLILQNNIKKSAPSITLFPKDHFISSVNSGNNSGTLQYDEDLAYKRYFFVNSNKNKILLVNDIAENEKRVRDNKNPDKLKVIRNCDAFYIETGSKDVIPVRKNLFKEKQQVIMTSSTFFNISNHILATLKKSSDGKNVKIAWMRIE